MTDALTEAQDEPAEPEFPGPRVLLLGSDELSRELVVALQRLGAQVIAADTHSDAPAHRVADESLVVDLTDTAELAALFERVQADFVVTLTDAVAFKALNELSLTDTELVPSARAVRVTADREGLRKLAADQLGLPTAPFWFVATLDELEAVAAHAGYPLLVKPSIGPPHQRQSFVVNGPEDVKRAWQHAGGGETAGEAYSVWAESVVEVEVLVTLIVVRSDGPAGPVIEFCAPIGHRRADGGELEAWQPQQLSTAALDAAKSIAARVVKELGGRGVFSVELMINGDEVYFADVAARPMASSWLTLRSHRLSVFELQARAILGLAVDTLMVSPGAARAVTGEAPGAEALTAALTVPESDVRVFGQTGRDGAAATGSLGVALATAPDVAAARDRARDVAERLSVRDSRG
ncbi:phosphoribosylglycinamide formyltransferase 2 [Mycobacterium asiaticum]|uniref:Phosphoribosylglycinamide formyltransferase 2 n=1 Tax=Mycobacterium asiaticum TaxID=1790 RepID=A0A1A3NII7_MYCAS|nr:formate-dependent phosphoribosylglycinamide formyltransferase [Mycobacterium asiaticum]OBK21616.1 phosphoribosylglycinamide formyltransferase 2 [Mycobacterium asiaticum]